MFEYHGNNLTVDADGVFVKVALAEPLDIEKPLTELDLTTGEVKAVGQVVVSRDCLPPHTDESEEEKDRSPDGYHYFINGYIPSDWHDGVDYEGWGNEEVIARAVPFLELGVKGLMAFCSQESQILKQWLEEANARSDELEIIAKERAETAAAELERVMPKRDPAIALEELKQFIQEHNLERDAHDSTFWKEIEGKKLHLHYSSYEMGPSWTPNDRYWEGMHEGVRLSQEEMPKGKYNGHLGDVTVSERGYFAAGKRGGVDLIFSNDARDCQDFPTVERALESLVPYILEGEEDWDFGPTLPGLPLPPKDDSDLGG
jgi:hypothetical protein